MEDYLKITSEDYFTQKRAYGSKRFIREYFARKGQRKGGAIFLGTS